MMEPQIKLIAKKVLVGLRATMSFADNRTSELWKRFMPLRDTIPNSVDGDLYSMQRYGPNFFTTFNPVAEFEKWAAVEVAAVNTIPTGMEVTTLTAGLYAVFMYKGPASEGPKFFQFIFGTWIPQSGYDVDDRPHFERLGAKYQHESPDSEEEIWIPVRLK